ncbi:MAG: hypothetical protein M3Y72_26795 [Acidobacteriota bacterium]|nr:hypothetical protein [Acidobacteriota bacterium]
MVEASTYNLLPSYGFATLMNYDDAITDSVNSVVNEFIKSWKSVNH